MKRLMDILGSLFLLVAGAPLLAACGLAVRLSSPGPVLFAQWRLGLRGRPFRLYKFRTMRYGAPDIRNADGSAFSSAEDPRVTRAGHFLRQTSLDELPQLVNVLFGDMSLVGPRPDQVDQLSYYTVEERRKLDAKPGLTGLAQIGGRNSIPWQERKRLDIAYVENQSLLLDCRILLRTIPYVLLRKDINAVAK
ncbi:MAG TPA: sugar transferase [Bryobacteraceae bacterium]|nr:sugar transferase [Bryobacteraceae bacterium]